MVAENHKDKKHTQRSSGRGAGGCGSGDGSVSSFSTLSSINNSNSSSSATTDHNNGSRSNNDEDSSSPGSLVGWRVRKFFPGFGFFEGTIISYNPSWEFYKVLYDDGDREDMDPLEVQQFLMEARARMELEPVASPAFACSLPAHGCLPVASQNVENVELSSGECARDVRLAVHLCPSKRSRQSERVCNSGTVSVTDVNGGSSAMLELSSPKTVAGATWPSTQEREYFSENDKLVLKRPRRDKSDRESNQPGESNGHCGETGNPSCRGTTVKDNIIRKAEEHMDLASTSKDFDLGDELHTSESSIVVEFGIAQPLSSVSTKWEPSLESNPPAEANTPQEGRNEPLVSITRQLEVHMDENLGSTFEDVGESSFLQESGIIQLLSSKLLPTFPPLPPSSDDLLVPQDSALDCLATYCFLRSFSRALFLSPFGLEAFQHAVCAETPTALFDSLHFCLLQVLRRHLERLSTAGSEPARTCLRHPDWTLLDLVTWPTHLMGFLAVYGFQKHYDRTFPLSIDYYKAAPETKLAVLSFLCDHVMDAEEIRLDIAMRDLSDAQKDSESDDLLQSVKGRLRCKQSGSLLQATEDERVGLGGVIGDENTDECMLCGMNGNLICCDSCPAAYHGRCVGISKCTLPPGNWFCPECTGGGASKVQSRFAGLRGADLLGVDPCGHSFLATCGYVLVTESYDSSRFHYYSSKDLPVLLDWLEGMTPLCDSIKTILMQECRSLNKTCNNLDSFTAQTASVSNQSPEMMSSVDFVSNKSFGEEQGCWDGRQPFFGQFSGGGEKEECLTESQAHSYTNLYVLGDAAATAAACLAHQSIKKKLKANPMTSQLDAFTSAPVHFCWPSVNRKLMELPKERCGWCFSCSNPVRKKGCLLNHAAEALAAGAFRIPGGISPTKCGLGHLPSVSGYLLYMEDSLKSLLLGPWDDVGFRTSWQKQVQQAQCVRDLKAPLLQLESCLRPVVLSGKWFSSQEDAPVWSFGVSPQVTALQNKMQKKSQNRSNATRRTQSDIELIMSLRSWKHSKISKKVFQWYLLPSQIARQAGRQGGIRKIQGLIYSEGLDAPKRNKHCAWQARVEAASTVSQLALQVRCLDACIRWDDLFVNSASVSKPEVKGTARTPIVHAKEWKGGVPMYLVDSQEVLGLLMELGQKGALPVINKNSVKMWLTENQIPLFLLRDFEERFRMQRQRHIQCTTLSRKPSLPTQNKQKKRKTAQILVKDGSFAVRDTPVLSREICQGKPRVSYNDHSWSYQDKLSESSAVTKEPYEGTAVSKHQISDSDSLDEESHIKSELSCLKTPMQKDCKSCQTADVSSLPKGEVTKEGAEGVRWRKKKETEYKCLDSSKILRPGQAASDSLGGPKCFLCCQIYDGQHLFIGCEFCPLWFHGDALKVTVDNVAEIARFKCHKCRKKGRPDCPYSIAKKNSLNQENLDSKGALDCIEAFNVLSGRLCKVQTSAELGGAKDEHLYHSPQKKRVVSSISGELGPNHHLDSGIKSSISIPRGLKDLQDVSYGWDGDNELQNTYHSPDLMRPTRVPLPGDCSDASLDETYSARNLTFP